MTRGKFVDDPASGCFLDLIVEKREQTHHHAKNAPKMGGDGADFRRIRRAVMGPSDCWQ